MRKGSFFQLAILAAVVFALAAVPAFAQGGKARQTGRVIDEGGNPVEGAEVKMDHTAASTGYDHVSMTTGADGTFTFAGMRGGAWIITVTKQGYMPNSTTAQVSSFSRNPDVVVQLQKAEEVTGGIRDEAEQLVAEADRLIGEGKYDDAIALYENFLQEHLDQPGIDRLYLLIGQLYEEKMDYETAIAQYEIYLESNPDDPNGLLTIANALIRKGEQEDIDRAKTYYEKLVTLKGDDPNILYTMGEVMLETLDYESAIQYYSKTIELAPDFADAYFKLGYAYYGTKDWANAKANLEKFVELAPERPEAELAKEDIVKCEEKLK